MSEQPSGEPKYRRVLLKLSGEAFAEEGEAGVSFQRAAALAEEISKVHSAGVEMAVVVGGGNIVRGSSASLSGVEKSAADYMGMLATVINSLALQDRLEHLGVDTRVQTAIAMHEVAEPLILRRAMRHLEKNRVVVFGAGTGSPYFTTDTAAALRALEIRAEVLLKATDVEGVYDRDPSKHPDARLLTRVDYSDALLHEYGVLDAAAFSLCRDYGLPIVVFNVRQVGNISRVIWGEQVGTLVGRFTNAGS